MFFAVSTVYHCSVTLFLRQAFDAEGSENTPDFRSEVVAPLLAGILRIYRQLFASAAFRDELFPAGIADVLQGILGDETPVAGFVLHPRGK